MKHIISLFFLILLALFCFGQNLTLGKSQMSNKQPKVLIDSSSYDSWPVTESVYLSNNGKYISYFVGNESMGCHTLILQTNDAKWKKTFPGIENMIFAANDRSAILTAADRIYIVKLGLGITDTLFDIISYKLPKNGNKEWIAYRQGVKGGKLILRNLENSRSFVFLSVKNYYFTGNGLIIVRDEEADASKREHLDWVNITNGKCSNLWKGSGTRNVIFSTDGNKMAFIANTQNNLAGKDGIWYYEWGKEEAHCILPDLSAIKDSNLELNSLQYFSMDNSRIFITLKERAVLEESTNIDLSQPEVWSFNDKVLQSQQRKGGKEKSDRYRAIVNILDGNVLRIEGKDEFSPVSYRPPLTDSILVLHREINIGGAGETWNSACKTTSYLVSTKTGERTSLNSISDDFYPNISKYEKYFIYSDKENKNFFTYEIATGIIRNITKNINTSWERRFTSPIACWVDNDSAVIMYDRNDIWMVDPKGIFFPVNLTRGYGRRNNIQLFLIINSDDPVFFQKGEKVFLTAFNPETKENGFYSFTFGNAIDPTLLTMGSVLYDIPNSAATPDGVNFTPRKARNANSYIVRRMSATEYPNLFYTTNFKTFVPITDFHPQTKYNWYSTELHKWKSLDDTFLKGILYKPENFDSTRRYPVIFYYYESLSDGLNAFLLPKALNNGCVINIPYYVSNGYLVFCPDIEYTIGDPMQGTYNAVVSAAKHLMKLPFVDEKRMGIQGCSWGGIQTNYLVTKTDLFAAACSASGVGDWISGFNSLTGEGASLQEMFQIGQFRMGGTLWDSLHSYIKSSPVLHADKISTPILLMHTKDDTGCPLGNIIEFFTALRRLGKKSWMLLYEGNHAVYGKEGEDFSVRMAQFFDHYLKDKAAPFWMTKGVPARSKGIDAGLNLDYTIKTPTSYIINDTISNTVKNESQ
ncbi:alpha/beta hydrolase family protein [Chitinophaga sp. RAB17]|uniref:alpha/beta hydrolase family protein n=1 Tax=Chitinophaga sp. RAB17 TaxID=3233049 RepID=UPI003F8F5D71